MTELARLAEAKVALDVTSSERATPEIFVRSKATLTSGLESRGLSLHRLNVLHDPIVTRQSRHRWTSGHEGLWLGEVRCLDLLGRGCTATCCERRGELAQRIREVAEQLDIPIVEEAGLVEMLCQIPLGEEIPPTLYVAVAEVLAHVFRLNHRIDEIG